MKRFFYYALGGGLGHVVRAVALARKMAVYGGTHWVVVNTPFAVAVERMAQVEKGLVFKTIDPTLGPKGVKRELESLHRSLRPDVLIVDTFPRGLGGELVGVLREAEHAMCVLISRGLPPSYVQEFRLGSFVGHHYDRVIGPGEPWGVGPDEIEAGERGRPVFLETAPFLIRDGDELLGLNEARELLKVESDEPVVLVVGSGNAFECREMEQLGGELVRRRLGGRGEIRIALPCPARDRRLVGADVRIDHWPLIELLPAVDWVVGSAGYHLFWETRVCSVPAVLIERARKYDCQVARASVGPEWSLEGVVERIGLARGLSVRSKASSVVYSNGASEAADWLLGKKKYAETFSKI